MAGNEEKAKSLVELAREEFGELSKEEEFLFSELGKSYIIDFSEIYYDIEHRTAPDTDELPSVDSSKIEWAINALSCENALSRVAFNNVNINGVMTFENLSIKWVAFFQSKFQWLIIYNTNIESVTINSCTFERVTLENAEIEDELYIWNSICMGEVLIQNSLLKGIDIDKTSVLGRWRPLYLKDVKIRGDILLKSISMDDSIVLDGINADGDLYIYNCCSTNSIDITRSIIRYLCDLSFSCWPPCVQFEHFEFAWIDDRSYTDAPSRIEWLERMPQDRYRPQPYEQCAKVLAKMGYEEDAKQIQVAKHKKHMEFKRKELPRWPHTWDGLAKWVGYCGSWLFGKTTGFGYYPFRAAVFMLALILLGSAIFTWGYFAGGMTATQTTFLSKESNGTLPGTAQWKRAVGKDDALQLMAGDYPHFKGLFYSLDTFIPLIDLHQESYWMPNANAPVWGYVLWGYLWFHILAGWVLTTLLIAGLTGIMRNHDRG